MIVDYKVLRPKFPNSPYPPYHTGFYLEEYFYDFYKQNKNKFDNLNRTLIPIFWTNLYCAFVPHRQLQAFIDLLPEGKYFTVSQHDDAILQTLPKNTINFVAGGNQGGIPIPLICAPIPENLIIENKKDIFCSFVGSFNTTDKGKCRTEIYNTFKNDSDFYFSCERWVPNITEDRLKNFINITTRSQFTLCPRGYGKQSFRLYEAMQLNSIPVFVYDDKFFPFDDVLNWNEFCVLIHESEIKELKQKLLSYTENDKIKMLAKIKELYPKYFTMQGMCENILRILSGK